MSTEVERHANGAIGDFTDRCLVAVGLASIIICYSTMSSAAEAGSAPNGALGFDPAALTFVDMGEAAGLGLGEFTLEAWFRLEGSVVLAGTGFWGTSLAPIMAKGRNDGPDATNLDINYTLGIGAENRIVFDFEDGVWGANHPVYGKTSVGLNEWHHVAATYDGFVLRLYLDGSLDTWRAVDFSPRSDTMQHFAIGSAIDSVGEPAGFFNGLIDEVRVWNYARSKADIRSSINEEVEVAPGLVGRWGMNEEAGAEVLDSSGNGHDGLISSASRAIGAPFDIALSPEMPTIVSPDESSTVGTPSTTLRVMVEHPDGALMEVTFYGRERQPPREDTYTIVVLPDTQFYVDAETVDLFRAQTQWTVDHHASDNIAFVAHVGDIIHHDTLPLQWSHADEAISILETIPELPYVLAVGNHDQLPLGDPDGTVSFNQYFPYTRYEGIFSWYGGHHGDDNDNSYVLFSAGDEDYIAVTVEYNAHQTAIDWADAVIEAHPERRAIVVAHSLIYTGTQGNFTGLGQPLWDAVKDNPNLFLMVGGHVYGEGHRTEVVNGNVIHILLANYQHRHNGGGSNLRLLELAPGDDAIHVRTFAPAQGQFETDEDSDFWLNESDPGGEYIELSRVTNVVRGGAAEFAWSGLEDGKTYDWFVEVHDGQRTVRGPNWSFDVEFETDCPADFDSSGEVRFDDFTMLLANWGLCPSLCPWDLDTSGDVGFPDLTLMLANWGLCDS